MSGGHWDHKHHIMQQFIEDLNLQIEENPDKFSQEVLDKFKQTIKFCKLAYDAVHYADYLLSGDYGDESFLRAWNKNIGTVHIIDDSIREKLSDMGMSISYNGEDDWFYWDTYKDTCYYEKTPEGVIKKVEEEK